MYMIEININIITSHITDKLNIKITENLCMQFTKYIFNTH